MIQYNVVFCENETEYLVGGNKWQVRIPKRKKRRHRVLHTTRKI